MVTGKSQPEVVIDGILLVFGKAPNRKQRFFSKESADGCMQPIVVGFPEYVPRLSRWHIAGDYL
jgi:hypothetical protein